MRRRPKGIPDSWERCDEIGHRLGVPFHTISKWVRNGYLTEHRKWNLLFVDWNEVMANRLCRAVYDRFLESLEKEELDRPKPKDPLKVEPDYS